MLTIELLPKQQRDPRYRLRYDGLGNIRLSNPQRSWIDSMLRKNMRGRKVALFLFTHGSTPLFAVGDEAFVQSFSKRKWRATSARLGRTDSRNKSQLLDDATAVLTASCIFWK